MPAEICYGFWGDSLIYVTRERLDKYVSYVKILKTLDKAKTLADVLINTNVSSLEQFLSKELDFWWEQQNPTSDRSREVNELPNLDLISIYSLFEYDYIDLLDDSSKDSELPTQISDLAIYGEISPATGYNPYSWDNSTLGQLQFISEQIDFKLTDESSLIANLYHTFW